jgi:Ca-activated chloride channel family protein
MDIRPSFMASTSGEALPLEDVAIDARLRDLIAEVEVEQKYRNDGKANIEAVYTFPLPLDAVLLELEVTIGEKAMRAAIVEKQAAEERYEEAIAEGDAAVMLEQAEPGLYTMNVGNVLPAERVTVRFRYGIALRWSGDTVRFFLPTTVAPRYGDSPLAPHQVPESALTVENRFGLTVRIEGLLRDARIDCPSHGLRQRVEDDAVILEFDAACAVMDRDFVLVLTAQGGARSYVLDGHDLGGRVVLASFQPRFGSLAQAEPRSVKIVVDCSGSMGGDSIAQAKRALAAIVDLLRPADHLNVIAFGSRAEALFARQEPCTATNLQKAHQFCAALDATLGGTEIGGALERAYASRTGGELPEDVLLITDGEVSRWQPVVDRAIASRHRIFTVGVGSSVAEAFVRALAERTDGACELVSPNEGMAERITRHFQRMGAPRSTRARIVWPDGVVEQWPSPLRQVFEGDTVIAWARFPRRPEGQITLEIEAAGGRTFHQSVRIEPLLVDEVIPQGVPSTLARLAAAMRLPELDDAPGGKEALDYQLVSRWTNCLVVVERAEGKKAQSLPELRKVKQTLAAGWGGVGAVTLDFAQMIVRDSVPMLDLSRGAKFSRLDIDDAMGGASADLPTALELGHRDADLQGLVAGLNAAPARIAAGLTLADLETFGVPQDLLSRLREDVVFGVPEAEVVLRFLERIAKSPLGGGLSKEVKRAIRSALRGMGGQGGRLDPLRWLKRGARRP